jgi:hypothetical protein
LAFLQNSNDNQFKGKIMNAVRKDTIVEVFRFSIKEPHAIDGILDPLTNSKLYEVQTTMGHRIVRDGDYILKDSVGNLQVVENERYKQLYLEIL